MMRAFLCLLFAVAYGRVVHQRPRSGMSAVPMIINGNDADVGEWPWQCAEFYFGSFYCGCSIVDSTHILIAAHCVEGVTPDFATYLIGAHDIYTQNQGNPREVQAIEISTHPDFDYDFVGVPINDVAVVTTEVITYDDYTQPIPQLAPSGAGDVFVGQECYITGWGDTWYEGLPNILQEAQIQVITLADCQERYSSTPYQVNDDSICLFKLNSDDEHTGSCYGDSGGPLVCRETSSSDWVQAGLTSWGYPPCGIDGSEDGLPSVYMAVGYESHRTFIDGVIDS